MSAANAYRQARLVAKLLDKVRWGTGTPAGNVSAKQGTVYIRLDGAAATTLYLKTSGGQTASTSGWTAVTSA